MFRFEHRVSEVDYMLGENVVVEEQDDELGSQLTDVGVFVGTEDEEGFGVVGGERGRVEQEEV